jgi:hypothetical protein
MKTFKQILADHYTVFEYGSIELAVKEWLTQKLQGTLPHKITNESSDAKIINKFINDLLGEL